MQNLTAQNTQLEEDLIALHTGNSQCKEWFYQSVLKLLQAPNLSAFMKADRLAEAFANLDVKIDYIKEQQRLLTHLKQQLELAKTYGKEEISKALLSFGVTKLEGLKISSLTVSKATQQSVAKLEILDEDALLKAGFFKVELVDLEAVEQALLSADQRHEVEKYADMRIEIVHKPATIRINRRKSFVSDESAYVEEVA